MKTNFFHFSHGSIDVTPAHPLQGLIGSRTVVDTTVRGGTHLSLFLHFQSLIFTLLLLIGLGFSSQAWADADIASVGTVFSVNSSTEKYAIFKDNWLTCTNCTDWTIKDWTAYNNHDFGTVGSFKLKGVAVSGWRSGSDWFAAKIFYKIYKSDASVPSSNTGEFGVGNYGESGDNPKQYICESCYNSDSSDKSVIGMDNQNVDLIGSREPGVYNMKIYTNTEKRYNGGNWDRKTDYSSVTATFTIPGFTTTSTSKDYGNVAINTENSATISFGTHYGTALTTSNCAITGTNKTLFTVTGISETGVTVQFKPTTAGSKSATLTITDANSKTCTITLTGTVPQTALTLDKNNSDTSGSANGSGTITLGSGSFTAIQPTRTGYSAEGYYLESGCSTKVSNASGSTLQVNVSGYTDANNKWIYTGSTKTLYTKWTAKGYKVTLNQTGATSPSTYQQPSVTYDAALPTLNNGHKPSKNYYDFSGYWTQNGTDGVWGDMLISSAMAWQEVSGYTGTVSSTLVWKKADNATVYPKWTPTTYSITYKDQGDVAFSGTSWSTEGTHPDSYTIETASITLASPAKIGYTFGGWFSDAACTEGNKVTQIALGSYGDKTFYAKWTPKTTSLKLHALEGDAIVFKPVTATYDATFDNSQMAQADTMRTGYYFDKFVSLAADDCDETKKARIILQLDNNALVFGKGQSCFTNGSRQWTRDIAELDIYARWIARTYLITLDNNGADITTGTASATATFDANTNIKDKITLPQKTNKVFAGYYVDQACTTTQLIDAGGNFLAGVSDVSNTYTDSQKKWKYPNTLTLYAKWIDRTPVTITFGVTNGTTKDATGAKTFTAKVNNVAITSPAILYSGDAIEFGYTPQVGTYISGSNGWASGGWYSDANIQGAQQYQASGNSYTYTVGASNANVYLYTAIVTNEFTTASADPSLGSASAKHGVAGPSLLDTISVESKTGYHFVNWAQTASNFEFEGGTNQNSATAYVALKNVADETITANFAVNTFKVRFNKNNSSATGTMGDQDFTYFAAQNLTANGFQLTGYDFAGWATDAEGAVVYNDQAEVSNLTDTHEGIVNLYAVWTEHKYDLNVVRRYLDLNGNVINTSPYQDVIEPTSSNAIGIVTSFTTTAYTSAQTGFYNDRWSVAAGAKVKCGSTTTDASSAEQIINGSAGKTSIDLTGYRVADNNAITIYDRWKENTRNVTVSATNGTIQGSVSQVTVGVYTPQTVTAVANTGYDFVNWTTSPATGNYEINLSASGSLTTEVRVTSTVKSDGTNAGSITANFTAHEYSITYNQNGGTGATNGTYTIESEAITLPQAPTMTKNGYTFGGWYTNAELTGDAVTTIPAGSHENKEFWAKWNLVTYHITYNTKGGSAVDPKDYTIETATFSLPTTTKAGFEFEGWYTNEACTEGKTTQIAKGTTGDKTFYAKWTPIHVYIEGRFSCRSEQGGDINKHVGGKEGEWSLTSKHVEMTWNGTNAYELNTWCTVAELSANRGSNETFIRVNTCVGSANLASDKCYGASGEHDITLSKSLTSAQLQQNNKSVKFRSNDDNSGPVILSYNPTTKVLSYTATAITYAVNFGKQGNGTIGAKVSNIDISTGQLISEHANVNFTATPESGYAIQGWYSDAECTQQIVAAGTSTTYDVNDVQATVNVCVKFITSEVFFINSEKWANVKIYDTNNDFGAWPGKAMTSAGQVSINGRTFDYYQANVTAGHSIVFNNGVDGDGKKQTADLVVAGHYGQYFLANKCFGASSNPQAADKPDGTWYNSLSAAQTAGISCYLDYLVTYNVNGGNGTLVAKVDDVTKESGLLVNPGVNVVFTATPTNDNYGVEGWYSDAECTHRIAGQTNNATTYTISGISADASVYVKFEPLYTVNLTCTNGTIKVNDVDVQSVKVGQQTSVTMTAAEGSGYNYEFGGWTLTNVAYEGEETALLNKTITIKADGEHTTDLAASCSFNVLYTINTGVATGDETKGSVKPAQKITGVGVLTHGTATAESLDSKQYSFDHWTLKVGTQDEYTDWTGHDTKAYGVELEEGETPEHATIHMSCIVADAKLTAHFKTRETVTIYFVNSEGWETVKLHLWGGTAEGTTWPGITPTKIDQKVNGHDVYSYTFDKGAYTMSVWNNGGDKSVDQNKTIDITIDEHNPVFNHRDNHLYPTLDAVVPDPYVNANWKLMFNNSSVTLNIVNYDQGHTWTCDVTASTYNAESNKNWVKMQKDGAWRSIASVAGVALNKDERRVLTTYPTNTVVAENDDNKSQIELSWDDAATMKNFTFTFNDESKALTVVYTQPSVLLWVNNADGTTATTYDVDATDALELRAYAKNATAACTYQFQYSTDNSTWVNIGTATSENIKKIHGSDLASVPATLGKYYFKVVMNTDAHNYEASVNVDLYKYYWVAIGGNHRYTWPSHIHCWNKATDVSEKSWPGTALTEVQGQWKFYKFKYPTYDRIKWNNGKSNDDQTHEITFNPNTLCYEITGDAQDHRWPTQVATCPNHIYLTFASNNHNVVMDGTVKLLPQVTYYGTKALTYTWSITSGADKVEISSTDGDSVLVTPKAIGDAAVKLVVSDGNDQAEYLNYIHVTEGFIIRVYNTYSDWAPRIKIFNHGVTTSTHSMVNEGNKWFSYTTTESKIDFLIAKADASMEKPDEMTVDVQNVTASGCWIVSDERVGGTAWDAKKHKMKKTDECDLYYRIQSVTENGTFTSNRVKDYNADISFYATTTGTLNVQHYDEAAKKFVTIKTLEDKPTENYVQTAKFTGNGISNLTKYTGDFYLRTNAKDNWDTYLIDSHKFTEFTRNKKFPNEAFNYYFVEHFAQNTQVTGCVANAINADLATYIKADEFTNSDGKITSAAANVRFGYCPETNYFKRAIIADATGSGTHFMDIYGDNSTYFNGGQGNSTLYADKDLNTLIYREANDTEGAHSQTLTDMSNWVYQTTVFATVDNMRSNDTKAIIASKFNGKWNYLLGYDEKNQCPTFAWTVLGATSTKNNVYEMTMIYDFKTNRLTSAWTPSTMTVTESVEVDAEVMFLRHENSDVAQVTIAPTPEGKDPITVNNLNGVVFCLELENDASKEGGNVEKHYWVSLPYDCKVGDIYGIEGYMTRWGIQRYRGDLRAQNGFWAEVDTYWEWADKDYVLKAGEGYAISIDKKLLDWKSIEIGGETRSIQRLYFPSQTTHLQMSRAEGEQAITTTYENQPCTITRDNRDKKDGNWKIIGAMSYNNATTSSYTDEAAHPEDYTAPNFRYAFTDAPLIKDQVYTAEPGCTQEGKPEVVYKAFYAYPVQFAGTIKWEPFTQDDQRPDQQAIAARRRTLDEEVSNATLKLELQHGGKMIDQTFVQFNDQATTSYDLNLDLGKMISNKYVSTICTYDNDLVKYAGNSMPADDYIIPLDVNIKTAGDYTFAMPEGTEGMVVTLIDNQTKVNTDLGLGSYTVNLGVADYSTRFAISIDNHKLPTATEVIDANGNKVIKFIRDEQLYILRDGKLYRATGSLVK